MPKHRYDDEKLIAAFRKKYNEVPGELDPSSKSEQEKARRREEELQAQAALQQEAQQRMMREQQQQQRQNEEPDSGSLWGSVTSTFGFS